MSDKELLHTYGTGERPSPYPCPCYHHMPSIFVVICCATCHARLSWPSCRPISTVATIGTTSSTHQTSCAWSVPMFRATEDDTISTIGCSTISRTTVATICRGALIGWRPSWVMLGLFLLSGCHYDVTSSFISCSHTSITTLSATFGR